MYLPVMPGDVNCACKAPEKVQCHVLPVANTHELAVGER